MIIAEHYRTRFSIGAELVWVWVGLGPSWFGSELTEADGLGPSWPVGCLPSESSCMMYDVAAVWCMMYNAIRPLAAMLYE